MEQGTRFIGKELSDALYDLQQTLMDTSMHALLSRVARTAADVARNGGKILFAGNGVSAAQAQQLALMVAHRVQSKRSALAAMALTTDCSFLTAAAREGVEHMFSRQIEAIGRSGDMFFALSASADEKNILHALNTAKRKNMICVGFAGQDGKAMIPLCDALIHVPASSPARVAQMHLALGTALASLAEHFYFYETEQAAPVDLREANAAALKKPEEASKDDYSDDLQEDVVSVRAGGSKENW